MSDVRESHRVLRRLRHQEAVLMLGAQVSGSVSLDGRQVSEMVSALLEAADFVRRLDARVAVLEGEARCGEIARRLDRQRVETMERQLDPRRVVFYPRGPRE